MIKALIIDDSQEVRTTIKDTLSSSDLDVQVLEAADGDEGVRKIGEANDYDIFIVDYHMPGYNGLEVAEKIRENSSFKATPIMVYTTETDKALIKKARRLERLTWVIKPMYGPNFIMAFKGSLGLKWKTGEKAS